MEAVQDLAERQALGRMLAMLRDAAGHTQEKFGQLISYSRSTLANVETGRQRMPRAFWVRCDEALPGDHALSVAYDRMTATVAEQRRIAASDIGTSSSKSATAHAVILRQAGHLSVDAGVIDASIAQISSASVGVTAETIDALIGQTADIATGYFNAGAHATVARAAVLRDAAAELATRTRRPQDLVSLYLVSSLTNALMASAIFDLADARNALALARTARTYADLAGHPSAIAWSDGLLASFANWSGRPNVALGYIDHGLAAQPVGTAAARLHHIAARSHALNGSTATVASAIAAADIAQAAARGTDLVHDELGGEFAFDNDRACACAGAAWLCLGDGPRATRYLEPVVATIGTHQAARAGAPIDLATADLLAGNFDRGAQLVDGVLTAPTAPRITVLASRLTTAHRALNAGARYGAAGAGLAERIATWTTTAPQLAAAAVTAH